MPNVLIYDTIGSHYNNVKATFDHYYNGDGVVYQTFFGFSEGYAVLIRDFCIQNNIKTVIIPYKSVPIPPLNALTTAGIMPVLVYSNSPNVSMLYRGFARLIQVSAGVTEPTDPTTISGNFLLDFFGEATNFIDTNQRIAPSYVCAKVGAFLATLIDSGLDVWQARQAIRSQLSVTGKLPNTIQIPEVAPNQGFPYGIEVWGTYVFFLAVPDLQFEANYFSPNDWDTNIGTFTQSPILYANPLNVEQDLTVTWDNGEFTVTLLANPDGAEPVPIEPPEPPIDPTEPEEAIPPIDLSNVTFKPLLQWLKLP